MKKNRFWAGLLGAVVALGCASTKAKGSEADRQPTYVDNVEAPATAHAGTGFKVTVNGNLPTPAWEIADVEVKQADSRVTITVWSRITNDGPVIQVLVPYAEEVSIPGLAAGKWTIEVVGHGGTGDRAEVQVQ